MMDFVNGKDDIPYMKWKIKFMFQTTKQMRIENLDFVWITYLTCFTALGKCPNCFTSLKYGRYVISNKYVFSLVFCETNAQAMGDKNQTQPSRGAPGESAPLCLVEASPCLAPRQNWPLAAGYLT